MDREYIIFILEKLYSKGCWGAGHLLIERLQHGVPPENRGTVKKALKELSKRKLVLAKKTKHGVAVYLNREELKEIRQIINIASKG